MDKVLARPSVPRRSPGAAPRLEASGVGRIATILVFLLLQATAFFAGAGSLAVRRGVVYFGAIVLYLLASMVVIAARFPEAVETINQRGKLARDVERWDYVVAALYTLASLVAPLVAGLDVRWNGVRWSSPLAALALVVTLLSFVLGQWAMVENRFAETGVRVQAERGHVVVTTGPYRFVRHPFYVGIIVQYLALPLCLGSALAFLPGAFIAVLFVVRTHLEDRTLMARLGGYAAYAERTRFRLVPFVW